jgi:uncharacterized membrane protein
VHSCVGMLGYVCERVKAPRGVSGWQQNMADCSRCPAAGFGHLLWQIVGDITVVLLLAEPPRKAASSPRLYQVSCSLKPPRQFALRIAVLAACTHCMLSDLIAYSRCHSGLLLGMPLARGYLLSVGADFLTSTAYRSPSSSCEPTITHCKYLPPTFLIAVMASGSSACTCL